MGKGKSNSYETTTTNYGFYFIFGLVTYFIWCDLSFFGELSAEKNTNLKFKNVTLISHKTIKLRMQDHFGHYIYLPFCTWANGVFHISEIPWMSPNVVTALHFFVAIICGRMFASASLFLRRIAVLLYEFRSMLDILDGVIYRAQSKSKDFISGWGTYGYMFDGLADTLGGLFIMVGTLYRFNKYPPLKNADTLAKLKTKHKAMDVEGGAGDRLLLSDSTCGGSDACYSGEEESGGYYGLKYRYTRKHINFITIFFTFTVILRSALWDHFNHNYHNLLGLKRADIPPERQAEVLNYSSTWFCIWLWKVHSADAFLHYALIAIFFGKLWRWLRFNLYASIPNIAIVALICQFHLMQMRSLLGVTN